MWERLRQMMVGMFWENRLFKAVALLLMLLSYTWVRGDREVTEAFYARVRLGVPDEYVLMSPPLERVKVSVRGKWSMLDRFEDNELEPIRLVLSPQDDKHYVEIAPDLISLPPGLRIVRLEPSRYRVDLDREVRERVTIQPMIVGEPPRSYELGEIEVEPEQIEIRGPRELLEDRRWVRTERIDVSDSSTDIDRQVRLDVGDPRIKYDFDKTIRVHIEILVQETERTIEDVPVVAVDTTHPVEITPAKTSVTVRGPRGAVEELRRDDLFAAIDLSKEDERPPGTFRKAAKIENLPDEIEEVRVYPKSFRVRTLERTVEAPEEPVGP
jgi:YbbR domain-containing protein